MTNKISIQDFITNIVGKHSSYDEFITRHYIPVMEKNEIITGIVNLLTSKVDDNGKIIEGSVELDVNPIIDEVFIYVSVIEEYTNIDTTNRQEVYDTFSEKGLFNQIFTEIGEDAFKLLTWFYERKEAKVEYLKSTQKTSFDLLIDELTNVVSTLPKSFDMKSIQPFMDKINSMKNVDEKKVIEALVKNTSKKNKFLGHLKKQKKINEA